MSQPTNQVHDPLLVTNQYTLGLVALKSCLCLRVPSLSRRHLTSFHWARYIVRPPFRPAAADPRVRFPHLNAPLLSYAMPTIRLGLGTLPPALSVSCILGIPLFVCNCVQYSFRGYISHSFIDRARLLGLENKDATSDL